VSKDGAYPEDRDFFPAIIVGVGAAAGGGGTRTVLVVLTNEVGGEISQLDLEFMSNGGEKKY